MNSSFRLPRLCSADSRPGSQGADMQDLEVKCGFPVHNGTTVVLILLKILKTSFINGLIMKNSLSIPIVLVF